MLALDGYLISGTEGLEDYEGRMDGRNYRTLELRELGGFMKMSAIIHVVYSAVYSSIAM